MKEIFEKYESEVRSYCRKFPEVFEKAKGSIIYDINNKNYIDFLCGAGALNYGHNNDYIKKEILNYIQEDGIMHALDMYTKPKAEFINYFEEKILKPRSLDYKIQFPSPTGTNAVEAALKLARKNKKRSSIWAFMGCFHGMSLGSLSLTSDKGSRLGAGVDLNNVVHIPAPYMGFDSIKYMQMILDDDHSGIEKPAAIIVETIQAEGGIYIFETSFLRNLRELCDKNDILLIVDDIQVGCCRTGNFFSFERAEIIPDIVVLSKSIGGYGFPLALTLLKPELDIWNPGEHNGTFRGNQLAIVAAKAGLEFVLNNNIETKVKEKENIVKNYLISNIANKNFDIRGLGLIWGIDVKNSELAASIVNECFKNNLIIERAGRNDSVVKIMPALTIENELLISGLEIVVNAINKFGNIQ